MKIMKSLLVLAISITSLLVATSCSDVQNREKESAKETVDQNTIDLEVVEKLTTEDGLTVENIDKNIETQISKSLSQILIKGTEKKELFMENALEQAKLIFADNSKAKSNEVQTSYYLLETNDPNTSLVTVQFSQSMTQEDGSKNSLSGKIYFNNEGKVLGFDVEKPEQKASDK